MSAGRVGPRKGRAVLLGSEFGAKAHFGWYGAPRYWNSPGKQFRPHRGSASYWFFRTVEASEPEIDRAYRFMVDEIAQRWARGG